MHYDYDYYKYTTFVKDHLWCLKAFVSSAITAGMNSPIQWIIDQVVPSDTCPRTECTQKLFNHPTHISLQFRRDDIIRIK